MGTDKLTFTEFIAAYPKVYAIMGVVLCLIILLVVFFILRLKIKNQEYLTRMARIEKERYRIAAEISNDILFEYDIRMDTMEYADKYKEIFGRDPFIYHYTDFWEQEEHIHPEDHNDFERYCKLLQGSKQMVEAEFRMMDGTGEYVWCHVRGKTIYDSKNNPIKIIGKLVNIDIQKKELEKLQRKSQLDPYTNVYNKIVVKERITERMRVSRPQDKHAMLILDIDNFKSINDTEGHLVGDQVIEKIVHQLKRMFRDEDIIGRIGGDEFVVFMNRINTREDISKKVDQLQLAISGHSREEDLNVDVSCSIGITIFPMDGDSYEELLDKADKALYEVKKNGKGNYNFYRS